ncbi:hypothetical protein QTO34_004115 [Cnephaeus nilssonii]|uniref:Uncharacterized protein n=1 Tax=Cnephaeus nilssonii TaxID=3371016 RepID=A0AA40HS08_CNENI|nr:hypothetical protein QTO34_004115 [Eptesicus nilssonii]
MAWSLRPHQPLRSVRFVRGAPPSRAALFGSPLEDLLAEQRSPCGSAVTTRGSSCIERLSPAGKPQMALPGLIVHHGVPRLACTISQSGCLLMEHPPCAAFAMTSSTSVRKIRRLSFELIRNLKKLVFFFKNIFLLTFRERAGISEENAEGGLHVDLAQIIKACDVCLKEDDNDKSVMNSVVFLLLILDLDKQ